MQKKCQETSSEIAKLTLKWKKIDQQIENIKKEVDEVNLEIKNAEQHKKWAEARVIHVRKNECSYIAVVDMDDNDKIALFTDC